jgi:alanine racemase
VTTPEGRNAWVEVDLGSYRANLRAIARRVAPAAVCAVVKANAYGHDLLACARTAVSAGVAMLAVALPEEGAELRRAGVTAPILVLGVTLPGDAKSIVGDALEAVVTTKESALALSDAASAAARIQRVHAKLDTGMGRVGVPVEEGAAFCRWVASLPALSLGGVMTHFMTSDEPDRSLSLRQLGRFREAIPTIAAAVPSRPVFHAANSGAITWMPESWLDMVRPGLLSYGVPPSPDAPDVGVRACLELKARITQVRMIEAGRPVGYGATWTTPRPSLLAVVPVGYADGYPRALSNCAHALVRGARAAVVGRVSMDQLMLDVTDCGASLGEEVVLIGRQGDSTVSLWELADQVPTIVDEIMVRLHPRLPRKLLTAPVGTQGPRPGPERPGEAPRVRDD